MSPEQQATTPEKPKEEYELVAEKLIADLAKIPEDEMIRRKTAMDDFLLDIIDRAESGEIVGKRGNVYDKETILKQFALYDGELKDRLPDPEATIPGFNGLRSAFKTLASNEVTGRFLADSVDEIVHGDWRNRVPVKQPEAVSAEAGEVEALRSKDNIQKVGEAELDAAGVNEPIPDVDPMKGAVRAASGLIEVPDFAKNSEAIPLPPAEIQTAPQAAVEQSPQEETELQMNERFLRETQAELQALYAELRTLKPGSNEAGSVENQIKFAKEDAGKFAGKVARLKGQNWT